MNTIKPRLVEQHKTTDDHTLEIYKSDDAYSFKVDGITCAISEKKIDGLIATIFQLARH